MTHEAPDAPPERVGRYQVLDEIARGGMGVVYRASDPGFDREVAIKLIQSRYAAHALARARFVEEARITGRLQHPGIPPVHEVGELPDGSPFLAMKLIRGRTLAELLAERPGATHELVRFVAVFEQICQAVAYAHSQGVIHRDLKTHNVMVGAFGEVQVMDWGLARDTGARSREADPTGDAGRPAVSRSEDRSALETEAGTVMGTPAYMAPEQARGEPVDARADVFGLGAVLCEILTGQPPYTGNTTETFAKAERADLAEAFARLDDSPGEPELVALARRCLSGDRDTRPADGGAVAEGVARLREAAEERARRAELDRAGAEAKAAEQRRKRRWQLAVAASLGLLLAAGGAFAWWQQKQTGDRRATEGRLAGERDAEKRLKADQAQSGITSLLRLATDLRTQARFAEAAEALRQARELAETGAPERTAAVEAAQTDLALVVDLDKIRYQKFVFTAGEGRRSDVNFTRVASAYRAAFLARGFNILAGDPVELAARLSASPIKRELVAALDDWAFHETQPTPRGRVQAVARAADPDPWTDRVRDDAWLKEREAFDRLLAEFDPHRASPAAVAVLALFMRGRWQVEPGGVLAAARLRHPHDFELAFLSGWYEQANPGRQVAAYEAARAIRPDNTAALNGLGNALLLTGDKEGAIAVLSEAVRLAPEHPSLHNNLAFALRRAGRRDAAVAEYRAALRLDPDDPVAHNNLGAALAAGGEWAEAEAEYRKALALHPDFASAHNNLGIVYRQRKERGKAKAEFLEAIRLDPSLGKAHGNLGVELAAAGDRDGAIAAYKKAVELEPNDAQALSNLGGMYITSDPATATALLRKAAELEPGYAPAQTGLGTLLLSQGKYAEALAHARAAVEADPKNPAAKMLLELATAVNKNKADQKTSPAPSRPLAPPPREVKR